MRVGPATHATPVPPQGTPHPSDEHVGLPPYSFGAFMHMMQMQFAAAMAQRAGPASVQPLPAGGEPPLGATHAAYAAATPQVHGYDTEYRMGAPRAAQPGSPRRSTTAQQAATHTPSRLQRSVRNFEHDLDAASPLKGPKVAEHTDSPAVEQPAISLRPGKGVKSVSDASSHMGSTTRETTATNVHPSAAEEAMRGVVSAVPTLSPPDRGEAKDKRRLSNGGPVPPIALPGSSGGAAPSQEIGGVVPNHEHDRSEVNNANALVLPRPRSARRSTQLSGDDAIAMALEAAADDSGVVSESNRPQSPTMAMLSQLDCNEETGVEGADKRKSQAYLRVKDNRIYDAEVTAGDESHMQGHENGYEPDIPIDKHGHSATNGSESPPVKSARLDSDATVVNERDDASVSSISPSRFASQPAMGSSRARSPDAPISFRNTANSVNDETSPPDEPDEDDLSLSDGDEELDEAAWYAKMEEKLIRRREERKQAAEKAAAEAAALAAQAEENAMNSQTMNKLNDLLSYAPEKTKDARLGVKSDDVMKSSTHRLARRAELVGVRVHVKEYARV